MDEHIYEQAQALTERRTQAAIDAARQAPQERPREVDGARVCLGCEEPLDDDRLNANPNAVRCQPCQSIHESRSRR